MSWLRPELLVRAGVALLVPFLLHLLRSRPSDPRPLPTARFLDDRPKLRVRWTSRLLHPTLWSLRTAVIGLVGLALAGPRWTSQPEGRAAVVLIDRFEVEPGNVDRARLAAAMEVSEEELLLLPYPVRPSEVPRAEWRAGSADESADPSEGDRSGALLDALRSVRSWAVTSSFDSLAVGHLGMPRIGSWDDALGAVRDTLWPARIPTIDRDAPGGPPADPSTSAVGRRAWLGSIDGGRYLEAALFALGWVPERSWDSAAPGETVPPLIVLSGTVAPTWLDEVRPRLDAGALLLTFGESPPEALSREDGFGARWSRRRDPRVLSISGLDLAALSVAEWIESEDRRPLERVRVLPWVDGSVAAAAVDVGEGCHVHAGFEVEGGEIVESPRFPTLLGRLIGLCSKERSDRHASDPIDPGALRRLEGEGLPHYLGADAVRLRSAGVDLRPLLLLLGLIGLLAEGVFSRRLEHPSAGGE